MEKEQVAEQSEQEFTKNEDGTVTVILSAATVAKIDALDEYARSRHPLYSIVRDIEEAVNASVKASGDAPSEIIEMLDGIKKDFKDNINYAGLVGAAIEATYRSTKHREDRDDMPGDLQALLKIAEIAGAHAVVGGHGAVASMSRALRDTAYMNLTNGFPSSGVGDR